MKRQVPLINPKVFRASAPLGEKDKGEEFYAMGNLKGSNNPFWGRTWSGFADGTGSAHGKATVDKIPCEGALK